MKITNLTRYSGRTLRSLITAVYRETAKHEGELHQWRHTDIEIVYARQRRGCSGRASIGGSWAVIRLTRDYCNVEGLVAVVEHELLHLWGYHHGPAFVGRGCRGGNASLAKALSERFGGTIHEAAKNQAERDVRSERYARTLASLERWEAKRKRAESAIRKLTVKKRYYERMLDLAAGNEVLG